MSDKRKTKPGPSGGNRAVVHGPPPRPAPRAAKTSATRTQRRFDPHSPWQRMVDGAMQEHSISMRDLSTMVSTKLSPIAHTTIWAWIGNKSGFPNTDVYGADVNARFARALKLKPEDLAAAFDASRMVFKEPAKPNLGIALTLRSLFNESPRKTWTKEQILELFDQALGR